VTPDESMERNRGTFTFVAGRKFEGVFSAPDSISAAVAHLGR
jgi:hypothetical protein